MISYRFVGLVEALKETAARRQGCRSPLSVGFAMLVLLWLIVNSGSVAAQAVHIDQSDAEGEASYARYVLTSGLDSFDDLLIVESTAAEFTLALRIDERLGQGAFAITSKEKRVAITGGDRRGLIYGAHTVIEQLHGGSTIDGIEAMVEKPALELRAIKFNLPWDSYRSSSALDLHYETVRDVAYWKAFLDMMAKNRFNALTLWNLHPFTYMIRAKNFPEASPYSDEELEEWRKLYQTIFSMAKLRGIDTYLVNWNVLVSQSFAEAHDLEGANYSPFYKGRADFVGEAQTSEVVKRYTRESVTQVLNEYPNLTGFGFSFGEQMGGMTPRERQDWMNETIIAGMAAADRPAKMIFRAPFSAGLGQGGSTDQVTEALTRDAIENLGNSFDGPIWMEIKFNWSHAHSTPDLIKVHGGALKDTYFKPMPENYKVSWMVRNEDFFALRWGSPRFIRAHIAKNTKASYVGGYFVGSESYIPAMDYFTAGSPEVPWEYAFERQWLFYQLWGRLLYNPLTPNSAFEGEFVRRYGEGARPLLAAYEAASQVQLDFATSIDFTWDFTVYSEGMMVLSRGGLEPISVERMIVQPPLRADWLSVEAFVEARVNGVPIAEGTVTPIGLAQRLEESALSALHAISEIDRAVTPGLAHEIADIEIWAYLGRHYAEKLRGVVALQTARVADDALSRAAAAKHLKNALDHWDTLVSISRPIYRDMPLTHYNRPNNQRIEDNFFHWSRLRAIIARDIDAAITSDVATTTTNNHASGSSKE